jgi:hypothetical protein
MLFDSIPEDSPKASIKRHLVSEYLEQSKSEFQIVCFLAFAAIKSIIQRQGVKKITKGYLLSRMAGYNGVSETLPDWIKKYGVRHNMDKIKQELQLNWGLNLYGIHTRGFYVSFKMDLDELAIYAEKKKKSNKIKILKQKKQQARIKALEHLGIEKEVNGRH